MAIETTKANRGVNIYFGPNLAKSIIIFEVVEVRPQSKPESMHDSRRNTLKLV